MTLHPQENSVFPHVTFYNPLIISPVFLHFLARSYLFTIFILINFYLFLFRDLFALLLWIRSTTSTKIWSFVKIQYFTNVQLHTNMLLARNVYELRKCGFLLVISVVSAAGTVGEYAFILKTGSAVPEVMSTDAGCVCFNTCWLRSYIQVHSFTLALALALACCLTSALCSVKTERQEELRQKNPRKVKVRF